MSSNSDRQWQRISSYQRATLRALESLSQIDLSVETHIAAETLLTIDKLRLKYYPATTASKDSATPPLLICYALVNRPYILDIEPERSLIADLNAQGVPVYLIDWGYPDLTDRHLGLDDYLLDYLDSCVDAVKAHSQHRQINLLGVCQGGVFSLLYSALKPEQINRLITLVTPVDAYAKGFTLGQMIRRVDVKRMVDAQGNLPGRLLNQVYASLKPLQLGVIKQIRLSENLISPHRAASFLKMEQWINDSPDLAGRAAAEFAQQFFLNNGLINGDFDIAGTPISLSSLQVPILNIFGKQDHLVPPASSRALSAALPDGLEYRELELAGGHIGAFVSDRSRQQVAEAVSEWISKGTCE